jgi:predicted nucleic acid-binding protein
MNFSDSLNNDKLALVLDASVLISINSCTYGKEIFSAIPNKIIVPKVVIEEFNRGTSDKNFLPELLAAGVLAAEDTTDEHEELLEQLLTTLDDGESATIAIAIKSNSLPVVDERKGRARATFLHASLDPAWSLDLLLHPEFITKVGSEKATEAVYLALRESHMRISELRADEIISLIGIEKARECICLPGYGRRFRQQLLS